MFSAWFFFAFSSFDVGDDADVEWFSTGILIININSIIISMAVIIALTIIELVIMKFTKRIPKIYSYL